MENGKKPDKTNITADASGSRYISTATSGTFKPLYWSNTPPAGCPFPQSEEFKGIYFTGRYAHYTNADTFYPTWASDGNLYSGFTDGDVAGDESYSSMFPAQTGQVKIIGDDPFNLKFVSLGAMEEDQNPWLNRYPSAYLVYNGVFYYGTYSVANKGCCDGVAGTEIGPFFGFRYSTDWDHYTRDWADGYWVQGKPDGSNPLFGENPDIAKVKMGTPHFVDFGKNMEHSPDGKAYLVAHGATNPEAWNGWIQGDQVYLARVKPSVETINDISAYEFYAGKNQKGEDIWSGDFKDIKPLIEWESQLGCVTMTYNAPLKKYFMCISRGLQSPYISRWVQVISEEAVKRESKDACYITMILESDSITGPFKMVHYLYKFGPEGYFATIPSKFISEDGKTMTLWYSANWSYKKRYRIPPAGEGGGGYHANVLEIRLVDDSVEPPPQMEPLPPLPLYEPLPRTSPNLAWEAEVEVSSTRHGYSKAGINDGVADGYPRNSSREWASDGEKRGAWVMLKWDSPKVVRRVKLFDRPNNTDSITSGILSFSDGSFIFIGALSPGGKETVFEFEPREVTWIRFTVHSVAPGTQNAGLSEFEVY